MRQKISYSNIRRTFQKIAKFGLYAPLSNIVLNYWGKYFNDRQKSKIYEKRNRIIQNHLKKVVDKVNHIDFKFQGESNDDMKIWVCWFQGEDEMPELVRICLSSIHRNANGHKVVLLTFSNYSDYVKLPPVIIERYHRGELQQAHFADLLRMNILSQRGGMWLDATMLVTKHIPDKYFSSPFFSIKTKNEGFFVSQCRWAVFALACQPGNILMTKVAKAFELYLSETCIFADYFMFDHFIDMLYNSDDEIKRLIDDVSLNNPQVHWLGAHIASEFDSAEFSKIEEDTTMFKLSNRAYSLDELNKEGTYYSHFKEMYLS